MPRNFFNLAYGITVILTSCCPAQQADKLPGKYVEEEYQANKVFIYQDSTFAYHANMGLMNDTVHGNWYVDNCNTIALIPKKKKGTHTVSSCDSCKTCSFSIYKKKNGEPLEVVGYHIYKDDTVIKSFVDTVNNELLLSNTKHIDSIKFDHISKHAYTLNLDVKTCHNKAFNVYLAEKPMIEFNKQKWKVKRGELKSPSGEIFKKIE